MSEQNTTTQPVNEQISEILLVLDKELKRIQAVKGISKDGELQTVDPNQKNESQFMRVDKHGDVFSNFFSNFFRQLKNPSRFNFFKVPAKSAGEIAGKIQQHINKPTKEGEKLMEQHAVKIDPKEEKEQQLKQENMKTEPSTTENNGYRYQPGQIDWETLSHLGYNRERLEKMDLMDTLLKGYKTNVLVPISLNLGTTILRTDARLSLQNGQDGKVVFAIHGMRKEPSLNYPFWGHEFTKEDKDNLLSSGNMGRVVDLKNPKTGDIISSIVSVDRLTNELVALRAEWMKVPDEIKGVKLDDHQKQILLEGKPLFLENMVSSKGEPFNSTVQFNADKKYVEFLFDRNVGQKNEQKIGELSSVEVPKIFRGKELTDEQYKDFKEGHTVYIDGLIDKKDQPYQGYITFNKENGKVDFSFKNPENILKNAKPTENHKTQVAVNSEGKTNESTKKIKEPLKSGQKNPDGNNQVKKRSRSI